MEEYLKQICDTTIKNYRFATQKLRYDGDYINHYSALLNGYYKRDIPYDEVKEIRKYIKNNTSKISVFRGDILYILSFLIALSSDDKFKICDKVIETFELLLNEKFKECEHLVLVAHSIVRYCKDDDETRLEIIKRAKDIFCMMKEKYGNLTKDDDYLLCAFLSLNCPNFKELEEIMEYTFNYMHELDMFSDNGVQCLTNSMLLNKNKDIIDKVSKVIYELERKEMKIGVQFLQLLGIMVKDEKIEDNIKTMEEVIEYLCSEESEYSFYIDKDFRNMIALVIAFSNNNERIKYLDELLAFGTYTFLVSKNQGILNEVLV